jgi:hypothetical protein
MSVAAFVRKPEYLKDEGGMYTPIATEEYFYNTWFPIIENLQLSWLIRMSFGLDITKENLAEVLNELNKLKIWIENPENARYTDLIERITNFENMLVKAFKVDENFEIFVG